jgi:hypothetical protein
MHSKSLLSSMRYLTFLLVARILGDDMDSHRAVVRGISAGHRCDVPVCAGFSAEATLAAAATFVAAMAAAFNIVIAKRHLMLVGAVPLTFHQMLFGGGVQRLDSTQRIDQLASRKWGGSDLCGTGDYRA